jgi:hypothetical protein
MQIFNLCEENEKSYVYRSFNTYWGKWEPWEFIEPRLGRTVLDRVNEIQDFIKRGIKYEIKELCLKDISEPTE